MHNTASEPKIRHTIPHKCGAGPGHYTVRRRPRNSTGRLGREIKEIRPPPPCPPNDEKAARPLFAAMEEEEEGPSTPLPLPLLWRPVCPIPPPPPPRLPPRRGPARNRGLIFGKYYNSIILIFLYITYCSSTTNSYFKKLRLAIQSRLAGAPLPAKRERTPPPPTNPTNHS